MCWIPLGKLRLSQTELHFKRRDSGKYVHHKNVFSLKSPIGVVETLGDVSEQYKLCQPLAVGKKIGVRQVALSQRQLTQHHATQTLSSILPRESQRTSQKWMGFIVDGSTERCRRQGSASAEATPCLSFFSTVAGAPSVVTDTRWIRSRPVEARQLRVSSHTILPVVLP